MPDIYPADTRQMASDAVLSISGNLITALACSIGARESAGSIRPIYSDDKRN